MKINIGDKVRFLNEIGGGRVSRVEGSNMVYVLDEDGFEVPALLTEVVLVEKKNGGAVKSSEQEEPEEIISYTETESDDEPKILLAVTQNENITSNALLYLINDSNYFAYYMIGRVNKDVLSPMYNGMLEPNTKVQLDDVAVNFLADKAAFTQILLFKKDKDYEPIPVVEEKVNWTGGKLLKDASYTNNAYLKSKACLFHLLKGSLEKKLEELTDKEIGKVIREKEKVNPKVEKKVKRRNDQSLLEVDLHIHELLDDTRGLSNREMLEIQMKEFHTIMKDNEKNKNRKIVFIHGVGNGVLKNEIRKELERKYKWHSFQDASFANYGYGATMVII